MQPAKMQLFHSVSSGATSSSLWYCYSSAPRTGKWTKYSDSSSYTYEIICLFPFFKWSHSLFLTGWYQHQVPLVWHSNRVERRRDGLASWKTLWDGEWEPGCSQEAWLCIFPSLHASPRCSTPTPASSQTGQRASRKQEHKPWGSIWQSHYVRIILRPLTSTSSRLSDFGFRFISHHIVNIFTPVCSWSVYRAR